MDTPEQRKKKIHNGAKYFLDIKPSKFNPIEVIRLHKFCEYILDGEKEEGQLDLLQEV